MEHVKIIQDDVFSKAHAMEIPPFLAQRLILAMHVASPWYLGGYGRKEPNAGSGYRFSVLERVTTALGLVFPTCLM